MDYANIAVERKDGIGRLTITRPEALNALDKATGEGLVVKYPALSLIHI